MRRLEGKGEAVVNAAAVIAGHHLLLGPAVTMTVRLRRATTIAGPQVVMVIDWTNQRTPGRYRKGAKR